MTPEELAMERKASLKRQAKKEAEREAEYRKHNPPPPKKRGRPKFNVRKSRDALKLPAEYIPPRIFE